MKKLKLEDVRLELPFNINYGMGDISIRYLIGDNPDKEIDWDVYLPSNKKNLQRGFVWTLDQKRELIYSVFKGIQLAPITVIYYEHKVYKIIDGKQRLSTLIDFGNNKFSIFWNEKEYYFKDLDSSLQHEFLSTGLLRSNIGYEYKDKMIPDDLKIAWFEMINFAGTPQDTEHLKYLKS